MHHKQARFNIHWKYSLLLAACETVQLFSKITMDCLEVHWEAGHRILQTVQSTPCGKQTKMQEVAWPNNHWLATVAVYFSSS